MGFSDQIDEFNQQVSEAVNKVIRDYQEKVTEELKLRNDEALRHLSEIQPKVSSSLLSEGMERLASSAREEGTGTSDHLLAAVQQLDQASDQVSMLKALLKGARAFAERSAFLLIKDGGLEGWAASGFDEEISSLEGVTFPSSEGWTRLLTGQGLVELSAADCGILCATYDAPLPAKGIAIPFTLDGQLAGALYADSDGDLDPSSLQVLTYIASQALHFTPAQPSVPSPTLAQWTPDALPLKAWSGEATPEIAEESVEAEVVVETQEEEVVVETQEEEVAVEAEGTQLLEIPLAETEDSMEPIAAVTEADEPEEQEIIEPLEEIDTPEMAGVDSDGTDSEQIIEEVAVTEDEADEAEVVEIEADEDEEPFVEAAMIEPDPQEVASDVFPFAEVEEEVEDEVEESVLASEAITEAYPEIEDIAEIADHAESDLGEAVESLYDPTITEAIADKVPDSPGWSSEALDHEPHSAPETDVVEAFSIVEAEPATDFEDIQEAEPEFEEPELEDTTGEDDVIVEAEEDPPIEAFSFEPPPELEVEAIEEEFVPDVVSETPESTEKTVRVSREMLDQYVNLETTPEEEPIIPQATVQIPTFQLPVEPEPTEEIPEDVTEEVEIPSLETAPWETPETPDHPPELDEVDLQEDATILLGQTVLPSPSLGEPAPSFDPPVFEPEPVPPTAMETEPVAPVETPQPTIPQPTQVDSLDDDDTNPTISRVQTKVIGGQVLPPADLGDRPGLAFQAASGGSSDTAIHDKARRLARLLVSEIKLYHEDQVEEGRRHYDIYDRLKDDIDRSRHNYEDRVDPRAKSIDHFYEALVKVLANGDPSALGM